MDFMLLEGYIRFLKNHVGDYKVVVPYAGEIAEKMPSRFPRSMRDFKQILGLIKVSALFHLAQRALLMRKVKYEVERNNPDVPEYKEREEHYVMATLQDFELVMRLWKEIQETTETSAPGHIIKFYHEVVLEVASELSEFAVGDLAETYNEKFEDKRSNGVIGKWVRFLCQVGYMNKQPDPKDKRRNLLSVIRKNRQYTLFKLSEIFGLDSLKAWLNEANQITSTNTFSLQENLVSKREVSMEDIYEKHFLNESGSVDVNLLSDFKADSAETTSEKTDFQKSGYYRDFSETLFQVKNWCHTNRNERSEIILTDLATFIKEQLHQDPQLVINKALTDAVLMSSPKPGRAVVL